MSEDINHFWNRLVASQLLTEKVCNNLRARYDAVNSGESTRLPMLVDWLCQQKAISRFQADILDAGMDGPFRFGTYRILEPLRVSENCALYAGIHELTSHPVLLEFFTGDEALDLHRWRDAGRIMEALRSSPHPNLVRSHEVVTIPEYRFLVSEFPQGKRLSKVLPENGRLRWKQASDMVAQLAAVVSHARANGLEMTTISPDLIWLSGQSVQVPPCIRAGQTTPEPAESPVALLGKLWLRLITGAVEPQSELSERKVPPAVEELIRATQNVPSDDRKLLNKIIELGKQVRPRETEIRITPRESEAAYRAWLTRTPEDILATHAKPVDPAEMPFVQQPNRQPTTDAVQVATVDDAENLVSGKRRSVLVPVLGSVALVTALVSVVVVIAVNQPYGNLRRAASRVENEPVDSGPATEWNELEPSETGPSPASTSSGNLEHKNIETITADDGHSLWESATTGAAVDFADVPYSPALAFYVRWSELKSSDAGRQTLQALGPDLNETIENWEALLGAKQDDIASVLVTLHTSDEFRYQPFTIVNLHRGYTIDELVEAWHATPADNGPGDTKFYRGENDTCYVPLTDGDLIRRFGLGSQQLVFEAIELKNANVLAGSMKRLAQWSDRERHANILFLTPALFNGEGQKLMSGPLLSWNRTLSVLLDRNLRGGLLSVHFDSAAYLELRVDSTIDLKPADVQQHVIELMDTAIDFVRHQSQTRSASDYWSKVSDRYAAMLQFVRDHFRFGEEDRQLIGNCWLPAPAVHNLLAATDLFFTVGYLPVADTEAGNNVPATIEELLSLPRDLAIATSPDLIVLLQNLQQEINDDFAQLPFPFEIRLMGADLAKEGITQNQRLGDIEMKQKPLSKILTEIMVQANPDKNISGASDPNCKIVWVVASDPEDSNRKIIMITTRQATSEQGLQLPEDFR